MTQGSKYPLQTPCFANQSTISLAKYRDKKKVTSQVANKS